MWENNIIVFFLIFRIFIFIFFKRQQQLWKGEPTEIQPPKISAWYKKTVVLEVPLAVGRNAPSPTPVIWIPIGHLICVSYFDHAKTMNPNPNHWDIPVPIPICERDLTTLPSSLDKGGDASLFV